MSIITHKNQQKSAKKLIKGYDYKRLKKCVLMMVMMMMAM